MPDSGVIPAIRVRNMREALDFYQKLGFVLRRGGTDEEHCSLSRGEASVMLETPAAFYSPVYNEAIRQRLGSASSMALYIEAADVDSLYASATRAGLEVIDPLADRPWGQAEFTVSDPEGNWLTFWKQIGGPS